MRSFVSNILFSAVGPLVPKNLLKKPYNILIQWELERQVYALCLCLCLCVYVTVHIV